MPSVLHNYNNNMKAPLIMNHREFESGKIEFGSMIENNYGKFVQLSYTDDNNTTNNNNTNDVYIQTPVMYCPFGVTKWTTGSILDCSFWSLDTLPEMQYFYKQLCMFEDHTTEYVHKHHDVLFKKSTQDYNIVKLEDVLKRYHPIIKHARDCQYPPSMRVKIAPYKAPSSSSPTVATLRYIPAVFDRQRKQTTLESIGKGCYVRLILHIPYIWVVNGQFGVCIRLYQAAVIEDKINTTSNFVDDDDDAITDESKLMIELLTELGDDF